MDRKNKKNTHFSVVKILHESSSKLIQRPTKNVSTMLRNYMTISTS